MSGIEDQPDELRALRDRVATLEGELRDVQRMLARCVTTAIVGSLVTQRLGRGEPPLAAGDTTPDTASLIDGLEKQTNTLWDILDEVAADGR